ncbi:MAG: inorganic pyrophosphatase [Acidobacteriota bacterium]
MNDSRKPQTLEALFKLFAAHPWHGIGIGPEAPHRVTAFIEITPVDTVKYELDKSSGRLKVDRPQKYSNQSPTLYGLIPQTYCGAGIGALCSERTGRSGIVGDGDPLDICVLAERSVLHGNVLLQAVPIGGLRMIDGGEADDKIVAVMSGDPAFGSLCEIGDVPSTFIDRLRHYFLTYKQHPDQTASHAEITDVYGRDEAHEVIQRARQDYRAAFPELQGLL